MFKVEYWSDYHNAWMGYVAPTFNARVVRHNSRDDAETRMKRLAADHPRDKFRVAVA
jgi:hypothetical protein